MPRKHPAHPPAKPAERSVRQEVEVDEPRERLGEGPERMELDPSEGTDEIGEERAETFLENVTGADDAATEHRAEETEADQGGPFVETTGATELAGGTDGSNPADAEREPLPTVSRPGPRSTPA